MESVHVANNLEEAIQQRLARFCRTAASAGRSVHLLWALMWLKCYHIELVGASLAGDNVDEKTYREKAWFYIKGLANLASEEVRLLSSPRLVCLMLCPSKVWLTLLHLLLSIADQMGQSIYWKHWSAHISFG